MGSVSKLSLISGIANLLTCGAAQQYQTVANATVDSSNDLTGDTHSSSGAESTLIASIAILSTWLVIAGVVLIFKFRGGCRGSYRKKEVVLIPDASEHASENESTVSASALQWDSMIEDKLSPVAPTEESDSIFSAKAEGFPTVPTIDAKADHCASLRRHLQQIQMGSVKQASPVASPEVSKIRKSSAGGSSRPMSPRVPPCTSNQQKLISPMSPISNSPIKTSKPPPNTSIAEQDRVDSKELSSPISKSKRERQHSPVFGGDNIHDDDGTSYMDQPLSPEDVFTYIRTPMSPDVGRIEEVIAAVNRLETELYACESSSYSAFSRPDELRCRLPELPDLLRSGIPDETLEGGEYSDALVELVGGSSVLEELASPPLNLFSDDPESRVKFRTTTAISDCSDIDGIETAWHDYLQTMGLDSGFDPDITMDGLAPLEESDDEELEHPDWQLTTRM